MKYLLHAILLLCLWWGPVCLTAASSQVTKHAKVELISETTRVVPGQTFYLALNFELEPHWHLYWKNPGASGLPVEIEWGLPDGFVADEIQWPAPERIELGGLISYGFEDTVTLIVPVKAPESLASEAPVSIKANVSWLICKEICLPGKARLTLELTVGKEAIKSERSPLFDEARSLFPADNVPWEVSAIIENQSLVFSLKQTGKQLLPDQLYFYSSAEGVVDPSAAQPFSFIGEGFAELSVPLAVEQLGKALDSFSGVLQSTNGSWRVEGPVGTTKAVDAAPVVVTTNTSKGVEGFLLSIGLPGWLLLAYLGGIVLNLMPCVLPVLSLKVFSLLKHSGQSHTQALLHGAAYSLGVVSSFLVLAGLLLSLRALGQQIGWGFQLQRPDFVAFLAVLIFLFALNLMGVFEIGTRFVGADDSLSKRHDLVGSFGMGILAAVVGSPCIGPFLAPVSGIALQADVITCLSIFGFMGLGLASPFIILSIFPKLAAYLPKPGAWMESLKQFMGFLLMATAVFLLYVAGTLGGTDAIIALLSALLVTAIAAWIYGRWAVPVKSKSTQHIAQVLGLILLLGALFYAVREVEISHQELIATDFLSKDSDSWAPWSAERVEAALSEGQPVFIDFTASWCLICQVNKKVALRTETTDALFKDYGVLKLEADWTRYDPEITGELERFGRSGVPLYVLYAPDGKITVLSQNLTNGKIREAVEKALN